VAGSLDLEKVISVLHESEFQTVIGSFKFDKNGDMDAPGFVWYIFEGDTYVPVQ